MTVRLTEALADEYSLRGKRISASASPTPQYVLSPHTLSRASKVWDMKTHVSAIFLRICAKLVFYYANQDFFLLILQILTCTCFLWHFKPIPLRNFHQLGPLFFCFLLQCPLLPPAAPATTATGRGGGGSISILSRALKTRMCSGVRSRSWVEP